MITLKDFLNIVASQFEGDYQMAKLVESKIVVQVGARAVTITADEHNISVVMNYDGEAPEEAGNFKIESG